MMNDLLYRIILSLAIILSGLLLYRLVSHRMLQQVQHKGVHLQMLQPGRLAIVYFTTPDCAPCKTIQRPALARLQSRMGDRLQVIEINAQEKPELAQEWGVLSVPTTFILDSSGQPRQVNHGVASTEKLLDQIQKVNEI
jgi:thioredoxin 1